jgi:vacuolar-type H+-ATPase subunit D/Vma8
MDIFPLRKPLYLYEELIQSKMTTNTIKKQLGGYLPLLSDKQQNLLLEMVKSFLNIDKDEKRITRKQYNKEIAEAIDRVEEGNFVTHEDALKELSK